MGDYSHYICPERFGREPKPHLLRDLADFIENQVSPARLDMRTWCGTARCAMGWAPQVPSIAKEGLHMVITDRGPELRLFDRDEDAMVKQPMAIGNYELGCNFDRAQWIFGITEDESMDVFMSSGLREDSPQDVAHRLRVLAQDYDGKPI